ncbi:MAG: DNA integrity scanning protein DisA nucleotide-binding domain protein [Clostridiales bacterium]|jgi:diadenylate cyclase|nr:DNA integrity scanning protein DisA nucleotide-binding domain protein [Clostridiales bacterium]
MGFYDYLTNIDAFLIIDLLIATAIGFIIFLFFYRKNSIRLAIIVAGIFILYLTVSVVNAYSKNNALYLSKIMLQFVIFFMSLIIAVVYQSEFKSTLARIGKPLEHDQTYRSTDDELLKVVAEIVKAAQKCSKNDIGALIVLTQSALPEIIINSGVVINALVSAPLIESIFNKYCPLHDGALVVKGNRLIAAGCFLQISQEIKLDKELGTRHRAALGITEIRPDVLAIVVSEETGIISIAKKGQIKRYITSEILQQELESFYGIARINTPVDRLRRK